MELTLQRFGNGEDSTGGLFYIYDYFYCFTIEDEQRDIKVADETRIPAGRYEVKFREVLSPMTERYRAKHPYFTWHLELQDVPNFQYCYIHIGNTDDHTSGCILTNSGIAKKGDDYIGSSSTKAFEEVYKEVSYALSSGKRVFINVLDEHHVVSPF